MKKRFSRAGTALCRYCTPYSEKGRKKCGHCGGFRLPNRREARRAGRRLENAEA